MRDAQATKADLATKTKVENVLVALLIVCCLTGAGFSGTNVAAKVSLENAPFDMPPIKPPVFPDRVVDICEHGAVGDGKTMNTKSFAAAIEACAEAGGGCVLVPPGRWLTGPIHLKSNINLHIENRAEILFSTRFDDYLPVVFTRYEGLECYNYSPLIYAADCTNIAITGGGKLDGRGRAWWHWTGPQKAAVKKLYDMAFEGVPVKERIFGNEQSPLRPAFIEPINCKNVLIEGVTIGSGPFWTVHPVYCENVTVRKVTIDNIGPNNDGITPDSCNGVLIEHCSFLTRDDTVTLKSGLNEDGWRVGRPCENVIVRHCSFKGQDKRRGGMVIGSDMSGGVRNVFVHDCHFDGADRGIRIKSMRGRGGVVENIWVRDLTIEYVTQQAIQINMFYGSSTVEPLSKAAPTFRNIHIENVTCRRALQAVNIKGLPERPIENVTLENVSITAEEGLVCTDAKDIKLINVGIKSQTNPVMLIRDSHDVTIERADCAQGTGTFLKLEGEKAQNILLKDTDLSNAKRDIVVDSSVRPDAVTVKESEASEFEQIDPAYLETDVQSLIQINSAADIVQKREALTRHIWGPTGLAASKLPDDVSENITDERYDELLQTGLKRIDKLTVAMDFGLDAIIYHFIPKNPNQELIIYHQGHRGDFVAGIDTIRSCLDRGYAVMACSMPLLGMNRRPVVELERFGRLKLNKHEHLKFLKNPIKYFVEPVATGLNYAAKFEYKRVSMTGISGGGWTTTLYAAIDPRISHSYPVAGSYPIYLRSDSRRDWGDYEQTLPDLYSVANYLELYIMGSHGKARKQIQILNKYDSCCFAGIKYRTYEEVVKAAVAGLGQGEFGIFSDDTHKEHKISANTLKLIFDDLQGHPD